MQIDAGISEVSVVTFAGGAPRPPPGTKVFGRRPEFLRAFLSDSERFSGPDPSGSAGAG